MSDAVIFDVNHNASAWSKFAATWNSGGVAFAHRYRLQYWPFQAAYLVNHITGLLLTLLNALAYAENKATGLRGDQVR